MKQRPIRRSIDPKKIRIDLGTQVRKGRCEATISEYAEAMEAGAKFPPPTVFYDRAGDLYILADGFHRLIAHLRIRPYEPIIIEQYHGTVEDALWYGIGANKSHGLKRTNEDKRNAVTMALLHPRGEKISNSKIAFHVGASEYLVRAVRSELESTSILSKSSQRIGADGRIYDVSNIGKRPDHPPCCGGCGHYCSPRCMMDDENHDPSEAACPDFVEIPQRKMKPEEDEETDDPGFERDYVPKEVRHRVSRRKSGQYIEVPLSRTNTDLAAVEIRYFFDENYLAALVQSALKLLES